MAKVEEPTVLFGKSKWIWAADAQKKNSNVIIRRTFDFGTEKPPARALCRAACDTHYYLYVNGTAAVWHGGMNRSEKHAYYDEFDIAKFLVKGENTIVVFCQYFGNDGRDLVTSPRAGFIFECNDLGIYSDATFSVYENQAYKKPRADNCCYAGWSMTYDAGLEGQIEKLFGPEFRSPLFAAATVLDSYPDSVMGILTARPLPLERFSPQPVIAKYKKTTDQFEGDKYIIQLPREMCVTPYLEVIGGGQEKITVYTDRTDCQGCFGDETSVYHAHTLEYLTKTTVNIFEGLIPMMGETLVFTMPHTVKVLKLGYRELSYKAAPTCELSTGDERFDKLFNKAMTTLHCCMGSTLMDSPERERTMWLGDSSIAARALFLGYADSSELIKKVIADIMDYDENDILYSCVPGNIPVDIPSHGLMALCEYGIFAQLMNFEGGHDFFRAEFTRLCDYLMQWEMTEHGVALREGNRRWYDNLYNIDEALIENALYYSACKFLVGAGAAIGEHEYDETFSDRMENISDYIESCWDGLGYTSREDGYDDRANALVALCGLVPDDRKQAIARILSAIYNASPYMEWAVIEALAKLGRRDLALKRFESRYILEADSANSTIGEDFNGFGTKCQSYQAAVISELILVFGGISIREGANKIDITPDFSALKDFRVALKLATGTIDIRYKYSPAKIDILIDNGTSGKVTLDILPENIGRSVERRSIIINKGKNKFSI